MRNALRQKKTTGKPCGLPVGERGEPAAPRKVGSKCRLQHLLQLIVDELDLGADHDLAGVLAGTDDARSARSLDGLLVHSGAVLHLKAQAGGAVIDAGHIALAADGCQHAAGDLGKVVVGQLDVGLGGFAVLVLTAAKRNTT